MIQTAEEFSKKYTRLRSSVALKDLSDFAIEFAKLHVTEALKQANEKVELKTFYDPVEERPYEDVIESSILNAYPLENIK